MGKAAKKSASDYLNLGEPERKTVTFRPKIETIDRAQEMAAKLDTFVGEFYEAAILKYCDDLEKEKK